MLDNFEFELTGQGLNLIHSPLAQIGGGQTIEHTSADSNHMKEADLSDPATALALGSTLFLLGSVIAIGYILDRNEYKNRQLRRQQEEQ